MDMKELQFRDFMPREKKTGKPIKISKPGNLHFHMNLGGCFDGVIQDQMNSFVPKHKSFIKPRDFSYVPKPTKEQEDAEHHLEAQKTQADLLFDQVTKD